jgi:hypothetical protein
VIEKKPGDLDTSRKKLSKNLPAGPGLGPHCRLAVGVGAEVIAVEAIAGVDLKP